MYRRTPEPAKIRTPAALDKTGKRYYNGTDKCDEGIKGRVCGKKAVLHLFPAALCMKEAFLFVPFRNCAAEINRFGEVRAMLKYSEPKSLCSGQVIFQDAYEYTLEDVIF